MKKNLLLAALVLPLLSVSAQWTQVGGTVKVKPNTLKYVSGDHEVAGGTESNEGHVNVRGNFTVDQAATFKNEWTDQKNYGQLIISDASTAMGNVISAYGTPGTDQFDYLAIAIPFTGLTADDLRVQAGLDGTDWQGHPGDGNFSSTRYNNPIFVWDNTNYAADDLAANDDIDPTKYHMLNQEVNSVLNRVVDYQGVPANQEHTVDITPFDVPDTSTNYTRNIFGEMLGTYLKDFFVFEDYSEWATQGAKAINEGFGDNLYNLGNPYTSNINLKSIPEFNSGNVKGVVQYMQSNFQAGVGSNLGVSIDPVISTFVDGSWAGPEVALEVRPFHTFGVKTNGSVNAFTLNDDVKSFNLNTDAPSYVNRGVNEGLYQVKMELYKNDTYLSGTYVVASSSFEAAAQAGNEAYRTEVNNNVNLIYTLQENEDGTVNQELKNSRVYINGINKDTYVAKPVMLVHQVKNPGQFTLKGILSADLINNGNEFFFEDVEEGFIQNITEDFEYTFTANSTSKDRFRIYWNGTPEVLNVSDVENVAKTLVYKNANESFSVRFAEHWNKAEVYVYNVMGQLVHSAKGIDTTIDYSIPLRGQSSAYIVKAVSETGESMTQKIIKK